jgi:hypothetical protein
MRLSPHSAPALNNSSVLPVHVTFGASPSGGGETPVERSGFLTFPMKIAVFRYDAEIVTTLFMSYDEHRRPRRAPPRGGSMTLKNSLPAVPRTGLGRESFIERKIFMVRVRTESIHI